MATFVSTVTLTKRGMKDVQKTCKRAEDVEAAAETMGVKVKGIYWTLGPQDGFLILDAPNEETAAALMLQIGAQGNVLTQTTRAFTAEEMEKIVTRL